MHNVHKCTFRDQCYFYSNLSATQTDYFWMHLYFSSKRGCFVLWFGSTSLLCQKEPFLWFPPPLVSYQRWESKVSLKAGVMGLKWTEGVGVSSQNQCEVHPREIEHAVNSSCKDLFKCICSECGSHIQFIVLHILRRNEWRWRLSNWGLCFWIISCSHTFWRRFCHRAFVGSQRAPEEGEMRLIKVKSRMLKNSG